MFRASREPRGPDPFLSYKLYIFFVGAALGLVGIATGRDAFVWAAIAVLAFGLVLRLLRR